MTNLIRLERPGEPIWCPETVASLKKALNDRGYNASDEDIQWAFLKWAENYGCDGWVDGAANRMETRVAGIMAYLTPATLPTALRRSLPSVIMLPDASKETQA